MSNAPWITPSSPPPHHGSASPATPPDPPPDGAGPKRRRDRPDRHSTPERVILHAWPDPLLDRTGFRPTGFYVERYWGPIVGPSCLLLVRGLARRIEADGDGLTVEAAALAADIGCSSKAGPASQFWRAVRRAQRFGLLRQHDDRLYVRQRIGPLSARLVHRLPAHLRTEHRVWLDEEGSPPPDRTGPPPELAGPAIDVLRRAARGLCTPTELRALDDRRLLG